MPARIAGISLGFLIDLGLQTKKHETRKSSSLVSIIQNMRNRLLVLFSCLMLLTSSALAQSRPTRLAVLDLGQGETGVRSARAIRAVL